MLLAAHHPHLKLLGLSAVHGNASLAQTTNSVLSILTALGRTDVAVYPGAVKPLRRDAVHAPNIHGKSGIDGTDLLPKPLTSPQTDVSAVRAMRDALLAQPAGSAYLIATGVLTNIAALFNEYPEVATHIKGLSIMGGVIGGGFTDAILGKVKGQGDRVGNHTPWAEFNIFCDPEAADLIFSNRELANKTTLIPLDLTHKVLATAPVQHRLLNGPDPRDPSTATPPPTEIQPLILRPLLHDLLTFFASTYANVYGITAGPPLHDPIAVAVILDAIGAEKLGFDGMKERYTVKVDTSDTEQVGRTMVSLTSSGEGVTIPKSLDAEGFWDLVEECIVRAEDVLRASG